MQRMQHKEGGLYLPTSLLQLPTKETISLLKYVSQPYISVASHTIISREWPALLNEVYTALIQCMNGDNGLSDMDQLQENTTNDAVTYLGDPSQEVPSQDLILINLQDSCKTPPGTKKCTHSADAPSRTCNNVRFVDILYVWSCDYTSQNFYLPPSWRSKGYFI